MNTDKYPFKKTFPHTGESFSALSAVRKWLSERGFSLGTLCSPEPCGIVVGECLVPKWRYLDQDKLDGMATAKDWRNGEITIHLLEDPG